MCEFDPVKGCRHGGFFGNRKEEFVIFASVEGLFRGGATIAGRVRNFGGDSGGEAEAEKVE
jgi:hypothetical protein